MMKMKKLCIPLNDICLSTSEYYNQHICPLAFNLNSNAFGKKREENEMKKTMMIEKEESSDSDESRSSEEKVKSVRKLVKIISSDSEDDADRSNSKKTVKKPKKKYQRHCSRLKKVTAAVEVDENEDPDFYLKKGESSDSDEEEESSDSDESYGSPSSEEVDENEDPDFDPKKIMKQRKDLKTRKNEIAEPSILFVKKEPMSSYEQMVQKNREERMAFLQSLKIEEAKAGLYEIAESVTKKKVQQTKRKFKVVEKPTSPPVLRKSRRLANFRIDLSEDALYYNALESSEANKQENLQNVLPSEMTFKEALGLEEIYESYKVDVNIQESKPETEFTIYDKSVLSKLSLSESNMAKVTPSRITALTWYPCPEQMIIAAGDKRGQLGIWNMESGDPYCFKSHLEGITNLKFSPYNQTHLISSSYDGVLRCGDMVQHNFTELYNVSDETCCTYFDVLSASTYLVAQKNGQVALVDKRTRSKRCEKKHVCHDYSIKTVNVHPTNKNYFITAENKGSIRLWDLRKLQSTPVADVTHHKRCVHSAFFSPVTGNSILALSSDDSISIFDSKNLSNDIKVRVQMKHNNNTGRWLSIFRATWLPNSEETFMVGSMLNPRRIEIYDKNMFVYKLIMHENLTTINSTNAFHPTRPALAGGNSSGKVVVFI